jgi:D-inositol-3-phosphate glycosyltransferase
VVLVGPDNAGALAWGIPEAVDRGPLAPAARQDAGMRLTVAQSVDTLLNVFAQPLPIPPVTIVQQLEKLILAPSAEVRRTVSPGRALTDAAS